jgi:hypothetical protein
MLKSPGSSESLPIGDCQLPIGSNRKSRRMRAVHAKHQLAIANRQSTM